MGSKASRARGGARLAGRAGRLPARKSRPRALGKCSRGACALHPAPPPRLSGRTSGRAGRRRRRERLGSAAGECARARRRGRRPCPSRTGARGPSRAGASGPGTAIRTPRIQLLGPRGPWAAAGREPVPRAWGRGRCNTVPLFLQLKAWGSDCSKGGGGRKNPGFRVSRPPPSLLGRGRGGTPCPPPPLPPWIRQPLTLRGTGEAQRPRPQLIWGSRRRPPSRTPQEYLLPSDLSPCCCSARPFGSQGGAQREPGLSRPHLAFGSMVSGAPWRVP